MSKTQPTTGGIVSEGWSRVGGSLTVKLMKVVHEGLHRSATRALPLQQTHLLSFSLVELEYNGQWKEDDRLNDTECTNRPSPSCSVQESLTCKRASEGSANEGCRHETPCEGSVAEAGGISHENIEDEVDGIVTDPIQHIASGIAVNAVAGCDDEDAEQVDAEEDKVAFGTTPDVEELRNWQFQHSTYDGREDLSGGVGGCGAEVGIRVDGGHGHD